MPDDPLMRWESEGGALGVTNGRRSATAKATPWDQADLGSHDRRGPVHQEPTSDSAFALAASTLALAMLTLFATLILADALGLFSILPLFVVSVALFIASMFFLWRWATGEAEASAAQEIAHRRREKGRQQ